MKEIPEGFRFWTSTEAQQAGLQWLWPSPAVIAERKPADLEATEKAKAEAEKRLRNLMALDLIPVDLQRRMVALEGVGTVGVLEEGKIPAGIPADRDVIAAQYQVDDLAVYWWQTSNSLVIGARWLGKDTATDVEQMRRLVEETARRLFVRPDGPIKALRVPAEWFAKRPYGAAGPLLVGNCTLERLPDGSGRLIRGEAVPVELSHITAYTDGATVLFRGIMTVPFEPRAARPGAAVNWF